jgi:sarcosine oxidase subunit alpha
MTGYRLPSSGATQGGAQIAFRFDGRRLAGRAGETLAAALLAAGERIVARSFKYHRPRGVYGFGLEEPNALVRCGEDPLALATRIRLADGLDAHPVNAAPSLRFDWREIHDWLSPLLPAGFYYKTFMGPAGAWPHWERAIRAAAGLARLDGSAPSWRRDTRHVHCDVLVVGAGPAGLAAARDLAASGARVVLADDGAAPGAANLDGMEAWIDGEPVADWARRATAEFDGAQACTRLADTLVFALHDHGFALAVQRDPADGMDARLWRIRAGRVILATGALERPALFAGNDRAGVMSLAAVRRYAERFAVACGRDLVVVANNSAAYGDVARLRRMGVAVSAIVDPRRRIPAGALDLAGRFGVAVLGGQSAIAAVGRTVEAVRVSSSGSAGRPRTLDCDVLAVSGGWTPLVHLHSQAGGRLDHDAALDAFLPRLDSRPVTSIGSCAGRMTLAAALADGKATARAIAAGLGRTVPAARIEDVIAPEDFDPDPAVLVEAPGAAVAGKVFVDLAADVTTADIRLAAREGYDSVELMKRYTTAGMAGDQGRHGNLDAIAVLAQARGDLPGSVGTTTYRPPFAPVEFGTIAPRAGWFLAPARATPLTPWHEAAGAVMYDVGANWRRPGYYPRPGETLETATARECVACRTGVAIYDSSPLGKFEFGGRDVTTFLERLYCNAWADLPPGMGRYGMMLFEDGRVFDDGIAFRLSARRFLVTTTTGNADTALARFEYHRQIVWPELDVRIVPVTAQWADIVVCGPKAGGDRRCGHRYRPLQRGLRVHGPPHRARRRHRRPRYARQLHRRTQLRDQRARPPRARPLDGADACRCGARHRAARFRGQPCPADREGVHLRRARGGRRRRSIRSRHGLDRRCRQAGFRRKAGAAAQPRRSRAARPARGPARRRSSRGAGGGRRGPRRGRTLGARACDGQLHEPDAGAFAGIGAGGGRTTADRHARAALRAVRQRERGGGRQAGLLRSQG